MKDRIMFKKLVFYKHKRMLLMHLTRNSKSHENNEFFIADIVQQTLRCCYRRYKMSDIIIPATPLDFHRVLRSMSKMICRIYFHGKRRPEPEIIGPWKQKTNQRIMSIEIHHPVSNKTLMNVISIVRIKRIA